MSTYEEVLIAARTLNPDERMRLAEAIWDDVPPEQWPPPSAEWGAEAQRRSAEFDAGSMSASAWSEVRARSRMKAGLDE